MIQLKTIISEIRKIKSSGTSQSDVQSFYTEKLSNINNKRGRIKYPLYHGTDVSPIQFKFDPNFDYENAPGKWDIELPEGYVFLTTHFLEAAQYGQYVIPCFVNAKDVITIKVDSYSPSVVFDEDFNYGTKYNIWQKFQGYQAVVIKGHDKSTIITYPELVTPMNDLAIQAYNLIGDTDV